MLMTHTLVCRDRAAVIYGQAPKGPRSALEQFALHKLIPRSLSQNHNFLLKLASTPKVRIEHFPLVSVKRVLLQPTCHKMVPS